MLATYSETARQLQEAENSGDYSKTPALKVELGRLRDKIISDIHSDATKEAICKNGTIPMPPDPYPPGPITPNVILPTIECENKNAMFVDSIKLLRTQLTHCALRAIQAEDVVTPNYAAKWA